MLFAMHKHPLRHWNGMAPAQHDPIKLTDRKLCKKLQQRSACSCRVQLQPPGPTADDHRQEQQQSTNLQKRTAQSIATGAFGFG